MDVLYILTKAGGGVGERYGLLEVFFRFFWWVGGGDLVFLLRTYTHERD